MAMDGFVLDALDTLAKPAEMVVAGAGLWADMARASPVALAVGIGLAAPSIWLTYRGQPSAALVSAAALGPGLWLLLSLVGFAWSYGEDRGRSFGSVTEASLTVGVWMLLFFAPAVLVGIWAAGRLRRRQIA